MRPEDQREAPSVEGTEALLRRLRVARYGVMTCAFLFTFAILGRFLVSPFFDEWRELGSPRSGLSLPLLVLAAMCLGLLAMSVAWVVRFVVWVLFEGPVRRAEALLLRLTMERRLRQEVLRPRSRHFG